MFKLAGKIIVNLKGSLVVIQSEEQRKKTRMKKNEQSLREIHCTLQTTHTRGVAFINDRKIKALPDKQQLRRSFSKSAL